VVSEGRCLRAFPPDSSKQQHAPLGLLSRQSLVSGQPCDLTERCRQATSVNRVGSKEKTLLAGAGPSATLGGTDPEPGVSGPDAKLPSVVSGLMPLFLAIPAK
jgi:hypothetical protein